MTNRSARSDHGASEPASLTPLARVQLGALALTIFVIPLLIWPGLTDYNYTKTIASLILISILLILWGLTAWRRSSWTIRVPWLLGPLAGLALAGAVSSIRAVNGHVVIQSVVLLVYFVLLLWMIADVVRDARSARWLLVSLLASGALVALYGILQYVGAVPGSPNGTGLSAVISSMGNRNHLGGFLLYLLYPSVIVLMGVRKQWAKALTLGAIVLAFVTMLSLNQSGTLIAFAVATVALVVGSLIFRPRRPVHANRGWLLALVVTVLAGGGALLVLSPFIAPSGGTPVTSLSNVTTGLSDLLEAHSSQTRVLDWWIGLDMFEDNPMTGAGLGNYKIDFIASKASFLATPRGRTYDIDISHASQAHNEYVQATAEMGIFGALLLAASLGTLAASLWVRLRRADEKERLDLLLLSAGLIALLVHAAVSFPAHVVGSSLELVLLCGLALSPSYGNAMTSTWRLQGWTARGLHVAVSVVALIVAGFAVADATANWLMERGIAQVKSGLYADGEQTLQRSLALDFAPRQTYYYLGIAQIQLGELEDAQKSLRKCMTRFVDEAALLNYANLLVNTGQSEQALAPLNLLLASHPRPEIEPRARYLHAMAVSETGNPEAAAASIEALLIEYPDYETPYIGLGAVYEKLGRYDDARAAYRRGQALIEQLLAEARASQASAATASAEAKARTKIEKLISERAVLEERLRNLPVPSIP